MKSKTMTPRKTGHKFSIRSSIMILSLGLSMLALNVAGILPSSPAGTTAVKITQINRSASLHQSELPGFSICGGTRDANINPLGICAQPQS
jgi:hypothetical protein